MCRPETSLRTNRITFKCPMVSNTFVVCIRFHGGARQVGNVKIVLEHFGTTLCLDYGALHSRSQNISEFPKVDAVAVSHAHADHISGLPYAMRQNDGTKVFGTETSRKITGHQLEDLVKIDERENKASGAKQRFSLEEALAVKNAWTPVNYGEEVAYKDFKIRFLNAGHIPGSAITEVSCDNKTITYTGDINLEGDLNGDVPALAALKKDPEVFIIESTYGNETRDDKHSTEEKFVSVVEEAIKSGKKVFIPAFAIERIQRVAYLLDGIAGRHPDYEFYVASPSYLAIKDIAYRALKLPNLKEVKTLPKDYDGRNTVVITTSGFCNGGISKSVFRRVVGRKDYTIILPSGYVPNDSPIKEALDKGSVTFTDYSTGESFEKTVKADIKRVKLSAHSDMNGLVKIVEAVCPSKTSRIVLVHGEEAAQTRLGEELKSRGYNVLAPALRDELQV